jgi:hypothetical protein
MKGRLRPRRPPHGLVRCGTAFGILLLLLAPVVGRITQQLTSGKRASHQLTFSRSGQRPPNRVTVARPGQAGPPEASAVLRLPPPVAIRQLVGWAPEPLQVREGFSDELRGPPGRLPSRSRL